MINIHLRMNKYVSFGPSKSGVLTVISFLFKNPSSKEINIVSRVLATIVALFCFLVRVCYFENIATRSVGQTVLSWEAMPKKEGRT